MLMYIVFDLFEIFVYRYEIFTNRKLKCFYSHKWDTAKSKNKNENIQFINVSA